MAGIIQEAKYSCALGAQQTVLGIPRAIPIIHAGPGCSARQFAYISNGSGFQGEGYAGGAQIPCTNSSQNEVVFGGEKKLGKLVDATLDVMDGDLYVVLAGCTAGIVGDDVKQVAADHSTENKKVIGVDTAGFRGNNYKGHNLVLEAIIDQFVGDEEQAVEKGLVNVFSVIPYQNINWRGDLEEIKRILTGIGLKVNILFGYGSGGAEEWKSIPKAELNIVLSPWVGLNAAKLCQRKYGTPFIHEPVLPVGLKATGAFLRRVANVLELDSDIVENFIAEEEKRYKQYFVSVGDFFADYSTFIPYDAYIAADDIYGVGLAAFLEEELGMEVVKFIDVSEPDKASRVRITENLNNIREGLGENVVFEGDNAIARKLIRQSIDERKNKSVIFGSSWDRELAAATKSILVCLSVPVQDLITVNRSYVGYNGALRLIEDIYSGVFDKGMITNTTSLEH
jgi:nitrogenase molybdenum-iron protein beta chain